jgi:3',5'-cyclic-nucleotide phosphodiesterase
MDYAACHVIYVDRTAHEDRLVRRNDVAPIDKGALAEDLAFALAPGRSISHVQRNLDILLGTFSEGEFGSRCFPPLCSSSR